MKVYDCTVTLREGMPIYPGDEGYRREMASSIAAGDSSNNSLLHIGAHTGTHVDALHHMIDGAPTVEMIPLESLVGRARVVQVDNPRVIGADELANHDWEGVERVLFRTVNSGKLEELDEFVEDFVHLDGPSAKFLAELGVLRLVGVDYLSVDRLHSGTHPAHEALMGAGVTIIEGLDLSEVPPGDYMLFCGPMKIEGGDGAPARVFLIQED